MDVYELISKNIRDIRCKNDMSVEELAELADISERNLYRIEAREIHPGFETIVKIAAALSVDIVKITGDTKSVLPEEDVDEQR